MNYMERVLVKGIYVVACCTLAPLVASLFITAFGSTLAESGLIVGTIGGVLLFVLLLVALWLGTRGKPSASWLTLSFGSWITTYIMLFLNNLLSSATGWRNPWLWITLVFIVCPCVFGGKAALQGRWGTILACWLGSFGILVPYVSWGASR